MGAKAKLLKLGTKEPEEVEAGREQACFNNHAGSRNM